MDGTDGYKHDEFTKKLAQLHSDLGADPESFHARADDLMIETLEKEGYDCSIFNEAEIWYA